MMRAILFSFPLLSLAAAAQPPASSAPPPPPTIIDIVRALEEAGFHPIVDVSMDDGGWEVEAYRGDQAVELLVDARTGKVLAEHRDDPEPRPSADALKLSELLTRIAKAGYAPIVEVSFSHRVWEVEAFRHGTKRELRVDPRTAEIISDRVDD